MVATSGIVQPTPTSSRARSYLLSFRTKTKKENRCVTTHNTGGAFIWPYHTATCYPYRWQQFKKKNNELPSSLGHRVRPYSHDDLAVGICKFNTPRDVEELTNENQDLQEQNSFLSQELEVIRAYLPRRSASSSRSALPKIGTRSEKSSDSTPASRGCRPAVYWRSFLGTKSNVA